MRRGVQDEQPNDIGHAGESMISVHILFDLRLVSHCGGISILILSDLTRHLKEDSTAVEEKASRRLSVVGEKFQALVAKALEVLGF